MAVVVVVVVVLVVVPGSLVRTNTQPVIHPPVKCNRASFLSLVHRVQLIFRAICQAV